MSEAVPLRLDSSRMSAGRRSSDRDRGAQARSSLEDQYYALLRQCIAECGWSIEALAAEMRLDKSYLRKLLHQEKPGWKPAYEIALPDDVEALFAERRAERFGRIVVRPVHGQAAVKSLVAGLFGVLGTPGALGDEP